MSPYAVCKWLSLVLVGALSVSCASLHEVSIDVGRPTSAAPRVSYPVVLARSFDYRPEALRESHEPAQSYQAVFTPFSIKSVHVGPRLYGDDEIELVVNGARGDTAVEGFDRYLRSVVSIAVGKEVSSSVELADPDSGTALARLVPRGEGIVLVPILDQLDLCTLVYEIHEDQSTNYDTRVGTDDNVVLVDQGNRRAMPGEEVRVLSESKRESGATPLVGNVRVRLIIVKVEAGREVRRATVYAAGAGSGLGRALVSAAVKLADGIQAFVATAATHG